MTKAQRVLADAVYDGLHNLPHTGDIELLEVTTGNVVRVRFEGQVYGIAVSAQTPPTDAQEQIIRTEALRAALIGAQVAPNHGIKELAELFEGWITSGEWSRRGEDVEL